MPDNTRCRMISAPGDPPGSRVTMARSFAASRRSRQHFDLGGFSGSLTALKGDKSSAPGSSFDRCLGHRQSFSTPARNMPITSSLTPSIARRIVDPVPTASAA